MKRIFYLRTYYQVIVALQMVNTICIDDEVVFLISDDSESTEMLVESLGKLGIVYKSILVKTKKLTYQKSMIDKIKDFVEVCFLKKNRYVIFLKEVLNEKFDEFIFFNYGVDTVAFYNLMVRNNINLRVSCIEEGILSYNSQFDNDHGKIVEISHYTRKILKRKTLKDNLHNFYCYYPILYRGNLVPVQIPRISVEAKITGILRNIFKPDNTIYTKKYIFFTSVYDFEGGNPIGEYELVCKVAKLVGIDNLLVKTHPRDSRTIYKDHGFNVDVNSSIPWEAIQLSGDFSDKVFLTINSGSVLSGSTMSEKPVKTFYMYKLCDIKENKSCQKNAQDIEALLCESSMKEVFRNVRIAEKIEDIL